MAPEPIAQRLYAAAARGDGRGAAAALAEGIRSVGRGTAGEGAEVVAITTTAAVTWDAGRLTALAEPLGRTVRVVPRMWATSALWDYAHHGVGTTGSVRLALAGFCMAHAAVAAPGRGPDGPARRDALACDLTAAWSGALTAEGLEREPPPWLEDAVVGSRVAT